MATMSPSELTSAIKEKYSSIADHQLGDAPQSDVYNRVAKSFGYDKFDLESLPDGANMGLSCGNPIGVAAIKEGETVVDLGCGGGLDVFLAAAKVGPTGQVIGVDMSESMLNLAHRNAAKAGLKPPHVSFQHTILPELPLESSSVDIFLSNCVINLLPDDGKRWVWKEMSRALKPGGRVVISDILAKKEMSPEMKNDIGKWVGCIAGASLVDNYRDYITEAGFSGVELIATGSDLSVYSSVPILGNEGDALATVSCCSPTPKNENAAEKVVTCCSVGLQSDSSSKAGEGCLTSNKCTPSGKVPSQDQSASDINEFVGSYLILAFKS